MEKNQGDSSLCYLHRGGIQPVLDNAQFDLPQSVYILIMILPLLAGAGTLWFAMPITELIVAVYSIRTIRKYTNRLSF